MHPQTAGVGVANQERQGIDGEFPDRRRALEGGIGGIESTTTAVDLDEEIRHAEPSRPLEQRSDTRRIIEDPNASLREHPESPHSRRGRFFRRLSPTGSRRVVRG